MMHQGDIREYNTRNSKKSAEDLIKMDKHMELFDKTLKSEIIEDPPFFSFKECPWCHEYFITNSFFTLTRTESCKIRTRGDTTGSGESEYKDGFVDTIFEVCPKGHKKEIKRTKRLK